MYTGAVWYAPHNYIVMVLSSTHYGKMTSQITQQVWMQIMQEGYHCFVLSFQCSLYRIFNWCVMLQGAGDTSNFEIVLPNIDRQIFTSVAKNTVNEAIHGWIKIKSDTLQNACECIFLVFADSRNFSHLGFHICVLCMCAYCMLSSDWLVCYSVIHDLFLRYHCTLTNFKLRRFTHWHLWQEFSTGIYRYLVICMLLVLNLVFET